MINPPSFGQPHPQQDTTSGPSGCGEGPLSKTCRMSSFERQVSLLLELPTS